MTTKEKNNINIPLAFDYKFKKVFGDNDDIDCLEALIALYFDIPYESVKGKVTILDGEKRKNRIKQKGGKSDIYLRLELQSGNTRIDIEVSDTKLSQSIVDRNVLYGVHNLTTQLQSSDDYSLLEPVIVICFDKGIIGENNNYLIDKYTLRNESGHKLTNKLQIHHINIENCYKEWYNKSINNYDISKQNIVKFGALLNIKDNSEFDKCLGGIPMSKEVKNKIKTINVELNEIGEVGMWWYDAERDRLAKEKGMMADIKKIATEQGIKQGIEQGINQRNIELAKSMIDKSIPIDDISEITGLSIEEIKKL